MLRIYNTLARDKQDFVPIEPGKVRMYVCGITVYDLCHVGHARSMIAFDVVQRWLRASGYAVTYVRNITDIDDKIIKRAVQNGERIGELTERMIAAMHADFAALGMQPPDHEPRATHYVPQMLSIIQTLQSKGLAYQAEPQGEAGGDVNYAVRRFEGYGKLSGKSLDDLRAGERVAVDHAKRDPLDFVLWKSAKPTEPPDSQWDSPWGSGRPGWHIECSAMAMGLLGETLDIHGGGPDLKFPHHENEIAQSEGATGQPFANVWMHAGALNVGNEKMSKSLNNFFTVRAALTRYDGEVIRFFVLRSHYRSQLNFAEDLLADAKAGLTRLYTALKDVAGDGAPLDWSEAHAQRFKEAMDDDFNTPIAVAALFDLANELNKTASAVLARQLKGLAGIFGILQQEPRAFLQGTVGGAGDEARIEQLIAERQSAKQAKDFVVADRIRAELIALGVILEDKPGGITEWRRA
jgi:cysteinyl-tRNA synthetase